VVDVALGAAAEQTSIDIRFWADTDEDYDQARVDNVVVSGDPGESIWPDDGDWDTPANCNCDDAGDESPSPLDLDGCPAVYYYFGEDYAFFRERVNGDPSGPGGFGQYA